MPRDKGARWDGGIQVGRCKDRGREAAVLPLGAF